MKQTGNREIKSEIMSRESEIMRRAKKQKWNREICGDTVSSTEKMSKKSRKGT